MHLVLIGLNGDAGQRRVALNVVRFAQEAVTGREAALEQFQQIDLAAGRGQGVEIEIMDVDVAGAVSLGLLRSQQVLLIVVLGAFAAVFEHDAHRGVAVDVRIVALHVRGVGGGVGQLVVNLHEPGFHLAGAGAPGAVKNAPAIFDSSYKAIRPSRFTIFFSMVAPPQNGYLYLVLSP